uniref:Uncharacterized protein n=1 Tax=Candidatus Kentrum sp. TC TaxID=2126339 RepID=A0A450ZTQ6_9GAMM|nr:MAG: hypothetical protein BECKTC1821F_GA0114240_101520 [Candidatus Kentron sp. TC]
MSKHSAVFSIPIIAMVALHGCAAVAPSVELMRIDEPRDLKGDEIDTFYLRESAIRIHASEKEDAPRIITQSLIRAHDDFKIGIRRADPFGVRTNLNLVKYENTALLKEIGVEVSDRRVELAGKVGTMVMSVARSVPRSVLENVRGRRELQPRALPKTIDVSGILRGIGREAKAGIDVGDGVTLDIGRAPPDAKSLAEFSFPITTSGLVYSACRPATVRFSHRGKRYEEMVTVNDPGYLQRVSFPEKGKIVFHSECGVSVSSENVASGGNAGILLKMTSIIEGLADKAKGK